VPAVGVCKASAAYLVQCCCGGVYKERDVFISVEAYVLSSTPQGSKFGFFPGRLRGTEPTYLNFC